MEYDYPLTKVDWPVAGVLQIPSSVGLVIIVTKNLQLFPANDKQGPAALTNNKHENVDHIQADKVIKCGSH